MSFAHLHVHSEYSLLLSTIRLKDLCRAARECGMRAVGLTDYGNLFGAVEFFGAAKQCGLKPLVGCEVFIPSYGDPTLRQFRRGIDSLYHLVLLIENAQGYRNLCQLLTESYLHGLYYRPRVGKEMLRRYSEGLLALSAGWGGEANQHLCHKNARAARASLEEYAQIFPGRFYVELTETGAPLQHEINLDLVDLASELNLPVVATNNCHYLQRQEAEAHEVLRRISNIGLPLFQEDEQFASDGFYFKSTADMETDFGWCPEALVTAGEIVERCGFELDFGSYHFPRYSVPAGKSLEDYLEEEARAGLAKRWPVIASRCVRGQADRALYEERLRHELAMIRQTGFAGYFLIVSDFIRYAKSCGIAVGPGRGSAAGSLVAYCLDITDLDPIPYDLLFERFLNPERISMPDVDIDFCMNRRDEVIDYVAKKYGSVSQIITFGKMKAKAVVRDVGRVMGMTYSDVDVIAKLIPNTLHITLASALETEPRLKARAAEDSQVAELLKVAQTLEGLSRHASTHAAGVVISDVPLTNFLPLYRSGDNDIVTQFDMKSVEKIGLIKFDFLGLKTLTVLEDTIRRVEHHRGYKIDLAAIPLDDPQVYEMLARGDTCGIFQLESSGMQDLIVKLKPTCFEDLIALVALYRPGPLGSGMVDDFIDRKHGRKKIVYPLAQLAPILHDTYGVIVYQEQVMQIASTLANYSLGEADLLRRAMGKKKPEEMAAQKVRFLQGCLENSIPRRQAEQIFDLMAKFAEYGFNKSHSAAYALIAYQTATLKRHARVESMAAILSGELENTDKILFYLNDCRQSGIQVLPPDINTGGPEFVVRDVANIHYGLAAIKNVGYGAVENIVGERTRGGLFLSLANFCERVDLRRVNRRMLESLVSSGAFDSISPSRRWCFDHLEELVALGLKRQQDRDLGQQTLFDVVEKSSRGTFGEDHGEWPGLKKLALEKEALGFYLTGHPLHSWVEDIRRLATCESDKIADVGQGSLVTLVGLPMAQRVIQTKKGDRMAFVSFEDLQGRFEVTVFSELFRQTVALLEGDTPLVIEAMVDMNEENVRLTAQSIRRLEDVRQAKANSLHFCLSEAGLDEKILPRLKKLLEGYPGSCPSYLHVIMKGGAEAILKLPDRMRCAPSDGLILGVKDLLGEQVQVVVR